MPQKVSFAARWDEDTLKAIKLRANATKLSVSEYVKRCALGTIEHDPSSVEQRFAELEDRIGRLERERPAQGGPSDDPGFG